jgi:hypothetical protein
MEILMHVDHAVDYGEFEIAVERRGRDSLPHNPRLRRSHQGHFDLSQNSTIDAFANWHLVGLPKSPLPIMKLFAIREATIFGMDEANDRHGAPSWLSGVDSGRTPPSRSRNNFSETHPFWEIMSVAHSVFQMRSAVSGSAPWI